MAFLVPILAGIGGGAAASALGAGALASTAVGVTTGAATAAAMNKAKKSSRASPTKAVEEKVEPVKETPKPPPAPTPPPPITYDPWQTYLDSLQSYPTYDGPASTSQAGGQADAAAAMPTASGPADVKAIETMTKGRRSTILTGAQGLLSDQEASTGILRKRRSLGSARLIT